MERFWWLLMWQESGYGRLEAGLVYLSWVLCCLRVILMLQRRVRVQVLAAVEEEDSRLV
jgi:hypothetical protein